MTEAALVWADSTAEVLACADIELDQIQLLVARFGLKLNAVSDHIPIEGSWFGEPEAGLVGRTVVVRSDTPVHSALHEMCHLICMDDERRATLHTDAGGDYDEENAVNYLQILLADYLPDMGSERMMEDMDRWGYTFRLGSAHDWFHRDAEDARQWLLKYGLIDKRDRPTWRLRGCDTALA